ncbi:MAG: non-hydrolyzing UDP-N-acetylglucosamine 2-epimerase [Terriglobales bacterium]
MKVVSIVGARPQFVKAAVVSRALHRIPEIRPLLVHTGQHYDHEMSRVFFEELDIPVPDYDLGIGSGSHGDQTGQMLIAIEQVLSDVLPQAVIVYGDTNSTLAGALAAVKLHIPVLHVEAGLRSFNRRMPEEINRVLTDHASDVLFVPTDRAVANLRHEGIPQDSIHRVGDVMYDAALLYAERADERSRALDPLGLTAGSYVLVTVHRAENTDDERRLSVICGTLARISQSMPVVFPIHPRTLKMLEKSGLKQSLHQLHLIGPVGYLDMVMLEKNARLIMTDSGGVQKEAFFYQVPCVTLRDETEWVELVELGWNRLAPPVSVEEQIKEIEASLSSPPAEQAQPYGTGDAGQKIAAIIASQYLDKPSLVSAAGGSPVSECLAD